MSSNTIELENVGPIPRLKIPAPEGGGVVVLRGRNGCGKSHALNGVESLYSKDTRKHLRNSDRTPSGTIKGLGVIVTLGRSKNTIKGELICESLDGCVDPSLLVDPGIKDPVKADSKRLATLIRLAGITVSAEAWAKSLGEAVTQLNLEDIVDPDPVVAADRIRRQLHKVALEHENRSKSLVQESATLAKTIADVDITQECDAGNLAAVLDKQTSALSEAIGRQGEHQAAISRQSEARLQIESVQLPDIDALNSDHLTAKSNRNALKEKLENLKQRLSLLKDDIADAEACEKVAEETERSSSHLLTQARQQVEQISKLTEIVDADIAASVSDEDIAILTDLKSAALEAVQNGETVRRAIATCEKAGKLSEESSEIAVVAEKLRDHARSTDQVLEQALVDKGFDTIKVSDGRLCVESDRGLEPFGELSHGERWTMALELAAKGLPPGSLLSVCQEAFESLDPANREHINKLAKKLKLVIVTAEATAGDLRPEVLV